LDGDLTRRMPSQFIDDVRTAVDHDLAQFFARERVRAQELSGDVLLVDSLAAVV
jgi:hypothetical protein